MCGIAGIFGYSASANPVDETQLLRVRESMVNRGPDGAGLWLSEDKRVGLAHRRLAIIDLSDNGAQPMPTADGAFRIVFNGEIYNYRELRANLEAKGYRFKSRSDTEVLLHLYREFGVEMLPQLRGMFAFAIWDERKRGMLLARDSFGIKPLYYADDGTTLRIASQVKALLKFNGIDASPEPAGHVGFHLWGHVPEPYTLYKGIRALPAGSSLWVDSDGLKEPRQFFDITQELVSASHIRLSITPEEMRERLRAALLDSVRRHLIADVPVGVFLSAGIDSTTLTALAKEAGIPELHTVTLGFKEYKGTSDDECPLAERTAVHYGTKHHTSWITGDDFRDEYQRLIESMDQPSIDGVNTYFVSKAAKEAGLKVVLSGLGGDELFGSYSDFHQIPRMVGAFGPFRSAKLVGQTIRTLVAPLIGPFTSHKYAGLFEYGGTYGGAYLLRRALNMPWALPGMLNEDMVRQGLRTLQVLPQLEETTRGVNSAHLKVSALETRWYMRNQLLRDTDWASMAHSTEIRVPLVDVDLFRTVASLQSSRLGPTKLDLARTPAAPVPQPILRRKKTGFSIPVRAWALRDRAAGNEGRGLMSWSRRVYREFVADGESTVARKPSVLVFRTGQLGDTLVALPAIEAIRRKHPGHRLLLLTNRHDSEPGFVSSWEVLGPTGWFQKVIFYDPGARGRSRYQTLRPVLEELRALNADHIYNLAPDRSQWQRWRDEVFFRVIVGGRNYHSPAPLRRMVKGGVELAEMEQEWRNILRSVRREGEILNDFQLPIPAADEAGAMAVAAAEGIDWKGRFLAVGPGSKMPAKRWPLERFRELGLRIEREFPDIRLIVLGGKEDDSVGKSLCAAWGGKAHTLAGKLSPYGSAAILKRCIAYVGNDTGTMHLAGMAGIPCVAIFSARDNPGKWEPYGREHVVIRREVECAGCMLEVCDRNENLCLTRISVDDVYSAARGLISALAVALPENT